MYGQFCHDNHLSFHINPSVLSPDSTTLFCTSGMHHYKEQFSNVHYHHTLSNIQRCLRLNDLDEIGDGTHYLIFHMLGLFSFREWSLPKTIDFWMSFLESIDLLPDYVTIHPDKYTSWKSFYQSYRVDIHEDSECIWNDGNIGGYCTEFYKDGIEIGNIVNTLDTCIDVGFGGERLLNLKGLLPTLSKTDILLDTIQTLLDNEIEMNHQKHGYILKKLITMLLYERVYFDHPYGETLYQQHREKWKFYLSHRYQTKFLDKSPLWWKDTHGIPVDREDMISFFKL